ncbi:MAG: C10 family peptidase [Candidatus Aegiribacteria sp.]|nr:C10 family peptidase [Candidatus Aegiribacteria sp.]
MKLSIVFMSIFAFFLGILNAMPVDQFEAESIAKARLTRDYRNFSFTIVSCTALENGQDQPPLAYVFELNPAGYIVTAADNELPPVIAYSYTDKCMIEEEERSILLDMVRRDIELRMSFLDDASPELLLVHRTWWEEYASGDYVLLSDHLTEQWPPEGSTPTGGWLMENWTQGAPYNDYCPMDLIASSRSVAGCPAVAMASILNFGETTNGTQFSDSDDYYHNYHEYYWIDDDHVAHDFPSWPELNVYLDILESHYINHVAITNSDKAALVYACGAACKQVYTASVSGTFGVNQAYDAYIKFDFTDCSLLDASSDSLFEKLSDNMMNAMPAHLAVVDAEPPTCGHNLIIDGYNTDEFYHLNFGWGGAYNGWYQFPLSGMPYSLNIIEGIILDIGEGQLSVEGETSQDETSVLFLSCRANPVSDYLVINLEVVQRCSVNLSVYSISGHLLKTVTDREFYPGSCQLDWVPGNIGNGVYILAASGSWGVETVRFTILD